MHPIYIILIVIASLSIAFLLLMLYMICPGKKRPGMEKFTQTRYAHRGLHDDKKSENSLSAFKAAKDAGFGIELDVRLSKDGELVVFHDENLTRMTGKEGKVVDYTAEELSKMSLNGTDDYIPTFREVLDLIDGSVPLLVELKKSHGEGEVAEKFLEVIEGYKGDFIVESFNPIALKVVRKGRPDILRGILSMDYSKEDRFKDKFLYKLLQNLMFNFLARPDFIAYEKGGFAVHTLRFIRQSFGTPLFAWTVKSQEDDDAAISHGFDTVIFEGYIPGK